MLRPEPNLNHIVHHPCFCSLPFTKLILNSWGEVSMCCHQLTQLGKIDENTNILDIWNSKLAKETRYVTSQGELHPICTSWNSCPYICKEKTAYPQPVYNRNAYPTYLEICLPDKHCNVGGETPDENNPACIMCRRNFHIPDQPDLTDFLCKKARPLMPYLLHLCVLGIAEPFWKDATFRIFDNLEFYRYKNQIQFVTNTNGICLNEKTTLRFFKETTKSDISWSIDAATPETHLKIRRLDSFDLVVDNLKRWIKIREDFGGKKQHKVCVYNNINMLNVHEMTQMVELACTLGVEKLVMLPTYDQAGVVQLGEILLNHKNIKVFKKSSEKAMIRAKELGVNLIYSKSFEEIPPTVDNLVQINLKNKEKFEENLIQLQATKKDDEQRLPDCLKPIDNNLLLDN